MFDTLVGITAKRLHSSIVFLEYSNMLGSLVSILSLVLLTAIYKTAALQY